MPHQGCTIYHCAVGISYAHYQPTLACPHWFQLWRSTAPSQIDEDTAMQDIDDDYFDPEAY